MLVLERFFNSINSIIRKPKKQERKPSYFEQQPGQDPSVHLDREVLSMFEQPGFVRGGRAVYVKGESLNDRGYVEIMLDDTESVRKIRSANS
jgi:hypothetical protein